MKGKAFASCTFREFFVPPRVLLKVENNHHLMFYIVIFWLGKMLVKKLQTTGNVFSFQNWRQAKQK